MKYYLKRLGHQELGSVKNGKAQRGRYIYISKDENVLDMFPPLSKTVTNDSSIIPIIPLYQKVVKKIYSFGFVFFDALNCVIKSL